MKNTDFVLKIIGQLSEKEQLDIYLLQRDKLIYRIPFPLPGQRPGATPGRYAYATPTP
ncbi:hypothetical protein [Hymenobacter cheonanensis]|uniref:hypothetical protein n=1 Tax=Hymenobacter sp. CA2-7 TaxID=3063993 RepID=UPI00271421BB|nr:hypothetical protein [Hymenobacter sp. CA2-7]MDO7886707.1 hypothetical protein [Hymenobacter sp. CA2-7]